MNRNSANHSRYPRNRRVASGQGADESGNVMVVTLLIMMVLTVMAISAINTSNVEMQIAQNDKTFRQNFFMAEAAMVEATKIIQEADTVNLKPGSGAFSAWLLSDTVDLENTATMLASSVVSSVDGSARYAATFRGIAGGGSLDMTSPTQLYEYHVFGLYYSQSRGVSHIVSGYRRRF